MSRPIDYNSREKHAATIDAMLTMIAKLETTIKANEPIGKVQRDDAVSVLAAARADLSRCFTPGGEMIKTIADFENPNHPEAEMWMSDLSIDLKLYEHSQPCRERMTLQRLAEGQTLVTGLAICRVSMVSY